jgi:hypothetical protein
MAEDEMAVVFDTAEAAREGGEAERAVLQLLPGARTVERRGRVNYLRIEPGQATSGRSRALRALPGVRYASSVFYERPGDARSRMVSSGEVVVVFGGAVSETDLAAFAARHGIGSVRGVDFMPNAYLFDARSAGDIVDLANRIAGEANVELATPNWIRIRVRR